MDLSLGIINESLSEAEKHFGLAD